ncbi:MAG: FtsX-like permease family protein [Firmicutes bacterium]|nr:FtsX-like permease family protein [Bacillota bacterium]
MDVWVQIPSTAPQNRRQLGILMSIGMSRSDITTLVAIQSLRMLLVSFLISIPLFYLLIFSMNSFLINQAGLLSSIISYSPLPIIISLLISIGSNIIAIIEPIVKFSKTELVNIIYNR